MLKRFIRSRDGNFAALSAIALVPFVAGIVGAMDYLRISNKAAEVQNALDARRRSRRKPQLGTGRMAISRFRISHEKSFVRALPLLLPGGRITIDVGPVSSFQCGSPMLLGQTALSLISAGATFQRSQSKCR